jgi:thymidylate synthase (FAD)
VVVDLIDSMGTDLDVVNAARVSFDKTSEFIRYVDADGEKENVLATKDIKLIKYLADHNHWSPFSHCYLKFRIKAPIFVARQLQKHTVGLAWNEVSRRYVDFEPEFYTPEVWRKRAENVKQGSSDAAVEGLYQYTTNDGRVVYAPVTAAYQSVLEVALEIYTEMLADGVCPEQARMVLPQSMMTEWIWSGSLYAFARVCKLRLDSHTQKETQEVAAGIHLHMRKLFPISTEALLG